MKTCLLIAVLFFVGCASAVDRELTQVADEESPGLNTTPAAGPMAKVLSQMADGDGLSGEQVEMLESACDFVSMTCLPIRRSHAWVFRHSADENRYIVMAIQGLVMIPGNSSAGVVLFSQDGRVLGRWHFLTGWRIDIVSAKFGYNKQLEAYTVSIHTEPVINGRDISKQIFSITGDSLLFVRMEDSKGELTGNSYYAPNHTLGGALPVKTKEQWIGFLSSDNMSKRLAALTYIAGYHLDPGKERETGVTLESAEEAKLAEEVRNDAAIKQLIAKYSKSGNKWLKEAAELASQAEPVDY